MSEIVGIKALTGEIVLGQVGTRQKIGLVQTSADSVGIEHCIKDCRVVSVGQNSQGQMMTQLAAWCPFQPNISFSIPEWEGMVMFQFQVPKQLEDIYLQAVTGIALAR